jgi:hypothetical protein
VLPLALLLSAAFSAFLVYTNPILNDDAFSFLRAAERFNSDGAGAMLDEYGWYGYSILIAVVDKLVPGDLLVSAHLVNGLNYVLLTWAFIELSRHMSVTAVGNWFAAAVILGFPLLNEMRHFIIRDVAYWAFSITAVLQLVRYEKTRALSNALGWSLCTLGATVFRLEALLPAMLAPFALLCTAQPWQHRTIALTRLLGVLAACLTLVLLLCLSLQIQPLELIQFAYRYYLPLLAELGSGLRDSALALNGTLFTASNFPGSDNVGHGLVLLLFANSYTVLANLVTALSVPLSVLLVVSCWRGKCRIPARSRPILLIYVACALVALLLFEFIMHFQTQRYATLLCLLLLAAVPGMLEEWQASAEAAGKLRRFRAVFGFACVYFLIDSLVSFGYSRDYLEEAVHWTEVSLPATATLATNVPAVAYASARIPAYDHIDRSAANAIANAGTSTYLILQLKANDATTRQLLSDSAHFVLEESFANEHGDEVRIYLNQASKPPGTF